MGGGKRETPGGAENVYINLGGGYISVITLKIFMELCILDLCSLLYLYLIENFTKKSHTVSCCV